MGEKLTFFSFFSFSHFHIETKLFCFYQNFISTTVLIIPKNLNLRQFSAKKLTTGRKNDFFLIFFSLLNLHIETKLFCFYRNFISITVLMIPINVNLRQFSAKKITAAQKNNFFWIFFSFLNLHIKTKLFCFYRNFISSTVLMIPKNVNLRQFSAKKITGARKITFFGFSFRF